MDLQDKTIIISGGGSGLGAGTAQTMVDAGANVIVADVNAETGGQVAAELGQQALFVQTDVTNLDQVQNVVDQAVSRYGNLYGLVNCAGIAIAEKVLSSRGNHDVGRFNQVIQVNLVGTFQMILAAAAVMNENEPLPSGERGVIVNTASVAAFDGQIGQAAYAASKSGIVGMTLPIAREFARAGIRVMTIAPGIFDTPMLAGLPEAARVSLAQQIPFPSRLAKPSEYAALVKHVFENEVLNGEVIRLDGAIRLAPR